jgi:hypothetical protein
MILVLTVLVDWTEEVTEPEPPELCQELASRMALDLI